MANKLALPCPRCSSALRPQTFGSVTIDLCDACGGHWYDPGELERIRQMVPGERPNTPPDAVGPRWVDSKPQAVMCPRCRQPLSTERYAYSSDLVLDRCHTCNGVWIDAGELDRMDALIAEWSHGVEHDQAAWKSRLSAVEETVGSRLDSASRPGRIGAIVGFLLDKLRRKTTMQ